MRDWLSRWRASDVPHRRQVLDALAQLPAIPEADRMRTRRVIVKPRTLREWTRLYGQHRQERAS